MCEIVDLESDDAILVSDEESEEEVTEVTPAAVLCVGIVEAGTERLLELLCRRHVSSVVDARVQPERSVAQLRRSCAARGLAFDWRPALSSRGSGAPAGDRAAAVLRLAAAAQGAGEKGWPCVLFAGEDWHRCPARQRLAEELGARHVELRHTSEKDRVSLCTHLLTAFGTSSLSSLRKKTDIEKRGTKKGRAGRAYDVALRRKRLRSLAKVALAAAAAGTQAALLERRRRDSQPNSAETLTCRWTNRGPAKEPVVDCQVPVEYGADAEDVEYDVVLDWSREELSSYFEKSSENDEALLELPWIDLAALAQLTYWYDRRPRGDEVELPKEDCKQ
ncbi:Delta(5) fatty acid desaturase B [Durusdinium trenchii]|uniref:Delta(5) fatty acid desaturase B n=1 Tax=Durusdinium trenchii TaxID=1381693 RepID=A0ABP0SPC2_9DINO